MGDAPEVYVSILSRLGANGFEAAKAATAGVWFGRGVRDAAHRLGLVEGEIEIAAPWAFGFESGARAALRMATAILSDPIVKGREHEALTMIEVGLGHADIIEKLTATASDSHANGEDNRQGRGIVVAFKAKGSRP
jgi:hypothetical protein